MVNSSNQDRLQADQVRDIEDYIKASRLEDIRDAKRNVHTVLNKTHEAQSAGKISRQQANGHVRRAIENFVREIRYPLKNTESGQDYWNEKDVGMVTIRPPSLPKIAWHHRNVNGIGGPSHESNPTQLPPEYEVDKQRTDLTAKGVKLTGLKSLFEAPNPISTTFTAVFHVRFHGTITHRMQKTQQLPLDILQTYFDMALDAAGDLDISVDLSEDAGDAGFEYSDVLEEGPPDEGDAPEFDLDGDES
jgi:hypothetical protein